MNNKIIKVAIYARVSTQEQATEGTSLENQADQLDSYCKSQGWVISQRYIDPGYTGKDDNRPALKQLITDAKNGFFEKVIVYALDRLARKLRLLLELEEKLKNYGIALYSIKEGMDTSKPIGHVIFQMFGMVSEWERDTIIERTRSGRLQRYKEGCWGPGNVSYGYDYDPISRKLVINETESRIILRIFNEYVSGHSFVKIANGLNDEKIPPRAKDGQGWRSTAIREIILNPAYKGSQVVNVHNSTNRIKSRFPKEMPQSAIYIKVPAIISDSIWVLAQEQRKNNKHVRPTRDNKWLLQGLITCGLCNHTFQTEASHNLRRYACRGRLSVNHLDKSPRCDSPRLDADWIEGQVWQRVEEIINDPNKLEFILKNTIENLKSRESDLNARLKPIDEQLTKIAEKKARLADDFVIANLDKNKFNQISQTLEREELHLKQIRSELDPAQLEELEHTRYLLRFWQSQQNALAWDTETEDGKKIRTIDKPHKTVLQIVGLEDKSTTELMKFPATKRELLNLLQVRIVVISKDEIHVNALLPIRPIDNQLLHPACR